MAQPSSQDVLEESFNGELSSAAAALLVKPVCVGVSLGDLLGILPLSLVLDVFNGRTFYGIQQHAQCVYFILWLCTNMPPQFRKSN